MGTPEQDFLNLIQPKKLVDGTDVTTLFDRLQSVEPSFMLGEWEGAIIDTGFSLPSLYGEGKWAGKTFKSVDEVHPMVLYDEQRKRYWAEEYGLARLREVKFRGVVSTALIYDTMPVMDSFRRISDDEVVGAADARMNTTTLFFVLKRLRKKGEVAAEV